jgi:UDP-glucose 4-epimerase
LSLSLDGARVAVTGGAGFIGSHLCDRIIRENPSRLVLVDDFSLGKQRNVRFLAGKPSVRIYRKDAADYAKMGRVLDKERIDVVFDLAVIPLPKSLVLPMETVETNVKLTTTLCELLRKERFKTLVHCSSSEAYGNALHVPMDESHPQLPLTPYAASKIAGDHVAISYNRAFDLDIAIVRPFNTYGPRQNEFSYAGVIPRTIMRMMNGEQPEIFGDGHQTRDFSYVGDTVEGIVDVFKTPSTRGRVVNIASGKEVRIKKIVETIAECMDYHGDIVYKPSRPGDVMRHRADISLAKSLFGYTPKTGLEEGLKKTVDWYRGESGVGAREKRQSVS